MVVIYPEWVEAQLKILDERIEQIYKAAYECGRVKPDEAFQIKQNLYEQTKAFVDEKVRLISNSCPKFVVEKRINLTNKDKEILKALIDIRNTCKNAADCTECKYNVDGGYSCYFMNGMPCDWTDLEKVFEKKDDGKDG